jgi:hypothetical protein
MTGRPAPGASEPRRGLPVLDRLAPAPSPGLVVARIDAYSGPGDIVADPFGRGGWIARAGLDRQRRVVSLESSPLARMLAEVVLRPPDVRHLDAAFQGIAASPRRESSLKVSLGDMFATRCATCGRMLVADQIEWQATDADGRPEPIARHYRCTVCRDQRGGGELREAPLDADDLARAMADVGSATVRRELAERFPPIDGAPNLVEELLDLHSPRQLVGLAAIVARIEGDLRAAPVLAALRLAVLHAILPASRLTTGQGRPSALRVAGGHVRLPGAASWRERNPWTCFEDGFRIVRGFVQGLGGGTFGPVPARLGEDLRSLGEGAATALLGLAGSGGVRALGLDGAATGRVDTPQVRLMLAQPPLRPTMDRLAAAYHGTAWVLGREAASLVPAGALAGSSLQAPWSWQAAAIGTTLEAMAPAMARDGRAVLLVEGGREALVSAVLGGSAAGYRLLSARLGDDDDTGSVELLPPNAVLPPGPRTRANVALPPVPGGAGDPDLVPGPGLFAAPERFDQRPFSTLEAARKVSETAVEMLKARGEPAREERLLGELLVGLDRTGLLRRYLAGTSGVAEDDAGPGAARAADDAAAPPEPAATPRELEETPLTDGEDPSLDAAPRPASVAPAAPPAADAEPADLVERLLALIDGELSRPTQHRVVEIEPGRWWLGDRHDREAAAAPLADRVEWSVFSLLSTAGPLPEAAFFERIAAIFTGHDLADEALVRACLDSYRSPASTPDRIVTTDDLLRRSQEHTELLAALADGGHRLGMQVWLGLREQSRRIDDAPIGDVLSERERDGSLGWLSRSEELLDVDCIWYVRGKLGFLFEVEWTAMLGEPLLRRHARIAPDERIVRFLVIAPERTELVRYKLARSPLLRAAMDEGAWHILKSNHLRSFLASDELDLAALEPLLGLDPLVERSGEQLPLFDA